MVIANLDGQVEKVFRLSVQRKPDDTATHTCGGDSFAASESATGATDESLITPSQMPRAQTDDESLDDSELPVWLL